MKLHPGSRTSIICSPTAWSSQTKKQSLVSLIPARGCFCLLQSSEVREQDEFLEVFRAIWGSSLHLEPLESIVIHEGTLVLSLSRAVPKIPESTGVSLPPLLHTKESNA